jgi:hypothetical protein
MLKRVEVSVEEEDDEEEEEEGAVESPPEATTIFAGVEEEVDETDSTVVTLLGLGSFLSCLGADDTSSETVAVTAGVESAEVAEADLDVLTIVFDYTHISSVFLSIF